MEGRVRTDPTAVIKSHSNDKTILIYAERMATQLRGRDTLPRLAQIIPASEQLNRPEAGLLRMALGNLIKHRPRAPIVIAAVGGGSRLLCKKEQVPVIQMKRESARGMRDLLKKVAATGTERRMTRSMSSQRQLRSKILLAMRTPTLATVATATTVICAARIQRVVIVIAEAETHVIPTGAGGLWKRSDTLVTSLDVTESCE